MIERRMNPQKVIEESIPKLIEAFVSFYGEEKREKIEKKFKDLVIIGYLPRDTFTSYKNALDREIAEEYVKEFSEKTGITSKKQLEAIFGNLLNLNLNIINYFSRSYNEGSHSLALIYLNQFLGTKGLTYNDEVVQDAVKLLLEIKPVLDEILVKYNDTKNKKNKKYEDYELQITKTERAIKHKNDIEFLSILEDKGLLSDHDKEIIHGDKFFYNSELDCQGVLTGEGKVLSSGYLESFDEESDAILDDAEMYQGAKNSIIKDRIKYFKKLGIDLGKNYDNYVNSEECQALWPKKELIEEIKELKAFYTRKSISETIEGMPHLRTLKEKLDSIPFLHDCNFADYILEDMTCIATNYVKEGDRVVSKPILFFSANCDVNIFDCRLIHELNHLYELNLIKVEDGEALSVSGWDIITESLNNMEADLYDSNGIKVRREYEMFSEVINELISQDLCKCMHDQGIYIMGDEKTSDNSSNTNYESILGVFVRGFYKEFKDEIIKSRENYDMKELFDVIGEENFKEFNNMLRAYSKRIERVGVKNFKSALRDGVDNRDTRYFYECIEKRDEFMERFRESKRQYLERQGKSI